MISRNNSTEKKEGKYENNEKKISEIQKVENYCGMLDEYSDSDISVDDTNDKTYVTSDKSDKSISDQSEHESISDPKDVLRVSLTLSEKILVSYVKHFTNLKIRNVHR